MPPVAGSGPIIASRCYHGVCGRLPARALDDPNGSSSQDVAAEGRMHVAALVADPAEGGSR